MTGPYKEILVYKDEGVDLLCLGYVIELLQDQVNKNFVIKTISAQEIKQNTWKDSCACLIFPGGRDIPYSKKLGAAGALNIKKYVESGGKYLGICAGAYFASSFVEFQKGGELEVLGKRSLEFFPGHAIGPALHGGVYSYSSLIGASAATMDWQGKTISCYYNGGCYFDEVGCSSSNVRVISRYQELEDKPASIVFCKVGKGSAILSGVHFEMGSENLKCKEPIKKSISEKLAVFENERMALSKTIFQYLEIL